MNTLGSPRRGASSRQTAAAAMALVLCAIAVPSAAAQLQGHMPTSTGRVSASADVSSWGVTLRITNESQRPVQSYYVGNTYRLTTIDGERYALEPRPLVAYPPEYINPGETVEYVLGLPPSLARLEEKRVLMLTCAIGAWPHDVHIVLQPVVDGAEAGYSPPPEVSGTRFGAFLVWNAIFVGLPTYDLQDRGRHPTWRNMMGWSALSLGILVDIAWLGSLLGGQNKKTARR